MNQTELALRRVEGEGLRQDRKWGGADHDDLHLPDDWIRILTRQMGKVAENVENGNSDGYEQSLVKVAAVCVAAVEQGQRRRMKGRTRDDS